MAAKEQLFVFFSLFLSSATPTRLSLVHLLTFHTSPSFNTHTITKQTNKQYYPDGELAAEATANARRYARLAAEAADAAMPPPTRGDLPDDVFDVLHRQVRIFFSDEDRARE